MPQSPLMPSIKAFVSKIQEKSKKISAEQKEKKARAKGFSSYESMSKFSTFAKEDGTEKANRQLRKKHLDETKREAFEDKMEGRSGKYRKYQKKVIKGIQSVNAIGAEYNEIMGELKSLGGGPQAYSSPGYGTKPRKKGNKRKPQKTKRKSRNKKPDFWDQFM